MRQSAIRISLTSYLNREKPKYSLGWVFVAIRLVLSGESPGSALLVTLCGGYIYVMQLELFPYDVISEDELGIVHRSIRNHYWYLRNARAWDSARRRRRYRLVADEENACC